MGKSLRSYTVVKEKELYVLIENVNKLIEKGWECQGGIASDLSHYYQAMVKYNDTIK